MDSSTRKGDSHPWNTNELILQFCHTEMYAFNHLRLPIDCTIDTFQRHGLDAQQLEEVIYAKRGRKDGFWNEISRSINQLNMFSLTHKPQRVLFRSAL